MVYSKFFFPQDRKIPTVVTIGTVLLIIFFLARYFGSVSFPSRASKKVVKKLSIVNPSHNQVGIFWQTEEKETGWVIYGQDERSLDTIALDERDIQDKRNLFYNHLAFLKNLQPDSQYYYKIVSNNQLVEAEDDKAFSFRTSANILLTSNLNPAYGKIIKENGEPLVDAVVLLSFDKAYPLAGLSRATGEWLISLNTILSKDQLKIKTVDIGDTLSLEIYSDDKKKTQIITDLSHVSPLPQTVIIGKNYNFLDLENVLAASAEAKIETKKIEILFPKESAVISGGNPLIKGTALPGMDVEVAIDSAKSYSLKTTADKEGVWRVILKEQLSPGQHVLKVVTKDAKGENVQLTRNFVIAKSGEQVLGEATAEATPTFAPTVMLSPSLTPTISILQTITPSITLVPGGNIIPIGVASTSLIIIGLGILLAF